MSLTLSDTAALILDPETVEEIAERYDGTPLGCCASQWLYAYSATLDLGFSEDTARRQAAAAWDAHRIQEARA
jgi:hypothetical protein